MQRFSVYFSARNYTIFLSQVKQQSTNYLIQKITIYETDLKRKYRIIWKMFCKTHLKKRNNFNHLSLAVRNLLASFRLNPRELISNVRVNTWVSTSHTPGHNAALFALNNHWATRLTVAGVVATGVRTSADHALGDIISRVISLADGPADNWYSDSLQLVGGATTSL